MLKSPISRHSTTFRDDKLPADLDDEQYEEGGKGNKHFDDGHLISFFAQLSPSGEEKSTRPWQRRARLSGFGSELYWLHL